MRVAKVPSASLSIWWSKHQRVNGLVIEHISPYQQRIVQPLLKDIANKTIKRFTDNWFSAGVPLSICFGISCYADWQFDQNARSHWP